MTTPTLIRPVREIEVPAPAFTEFRLRLEGTSPLITDRFTEADKDKLAAAQSGKAKAKLPPRKPDVEYRDSAYRLAGGGYGFPKLAFRKAIHAAALRMTELKGTEVLAAFQIMSSDDLLPLEVDESSMRTDHVVRRGTGGLSYRSQFFPWAVVLPVKLDHHVVSLEQFVHAVHKAGVGVGVGNWRPEKKGDYGCWVVTQITDVIVTGEEEAAA